ncbi:MAG: aspartate aminotransferase family protein, partial [Chitinophagales bacterium]
MKASNFYLDKHLAQTTPYNMGIEVSHADGIYIYDVSGKRYTDLISGLGVSALGHNNPSVNEALKAQIDKYLHVMVYGEFIQKPQLELGKLLTSTLPKPLDTCYFVNSGTEANEAALKLAKRVTGRKKIISFVGAYHGSTHGSLSVSSNEKKKYAFRPLLPQIDFIRLNEMEDLERIDEDCACVILETIQGDAGIRIPTLAFLESLRTRCNETGTVLIFDEIQAGLGRSGTLWAFDYYGVVPDILTLGKALGGGLPIGALVSSKEKMAQFTFDPVLGHITTFGGHPLVCTAAHAGLKYLLEKDLVEGVNEKGKLLHDLLIGHSLVREIRYRGLFFAIEMESAEVVQKIVEGCLEAGLVTFWFLSSPNAFRLAPPLTISEEEIRESVRTMLEVFDR